jgi:hypothetical protein
LVILSLGLIRLSDVTESNPFHWAVTHLSVNNQSLLVVLEGLLVLPSGVIHCSDVIESSSSGLICLSDAIEGSPFRYTVTHLSMDNQSLLEVL